ncbi:hypothetical protein LguiA_033821 [Lonicera macranthoides]
MLAGLARVGLTPHNIKVQHEEILSGFFLPHDWYDIELMNRLFRNSIRKKLVNTTKLFFTEFGDRFLYFALVGDFVVIGAGGESEQADAEPNLGWEVKWQLRASRYSRFNFSPPSQFQVWMLKIQPFSPLKKPLPNNIKMTFRFLKLGLGPVQFFSKFSRIVSRTGFIIKDVSKRYKVGIEGLFHVVLGEAKFHHKAMAAVAVEALIWWRIFAAITQNVLYYAAANRVQIARNEIEDKNKEIDFKLLFQTCTKTHLIKRLHALLIVSAKAKSIFIAT